MQSFVWADRIGSPDLIAISSGSTIEYENSRANFCASKQLHVDI